MIPGQRRNIKEMLRRAREKWGSPGSTNKDAD